MKYGGYFNTSVTERTEITRIVKIVSWSERIICDILSVT